MAGRPRVFEETTAVKKAADLFWAKGYEATSTDDLIKAMGIQRGSFYNTFNSKKELFIKAINLHERSSLLQLKEMLAVSEHPIETLKAVFLDMAECGDKNHLKGCFAGNTLAELSGIDEELAENAKLHLKEMESVIFNAIVKAKTNGQLKTKTDARLLSRYFLNLWNGLNITRRVYGNKSILLPLIKLQLEILK